RIIGSRGRRIDQQQKPVSLYAEAYNHFLQSMGGDPLPLSGGAEAREAVLLTRRMASQRIRTRPEIGPRHKYVEAGHADRSNNAEFGFVCLTYLKMRWRRNEAPDGFPNK